MKSLRKVPRLRSRAIPALMLAAITTIALVGVAFADAPDPKPSAATVRTAERATVNGVEVVRVSVSGGWQWPTHKSNCNTNRTGAGYAIDWNDPNAGGNHVTTLDTAGSIDVGSTGNAYNPADNEVHPTRPEESGSQFNDPGSPGSFASWKGGCGKFNGNFNEGVWGAVDLATGQPVTCTSATTPSPTCLGGSHVYTVASLSQGLKICSIMYDVHGGDSNQGGAPNGTKETTAGGSGHNGDNGAEKNDSTPLGNTCAPIEVPPPPTPTPSPTPCNNGQTPPPGGCPTPTPTPTFCSNGKTPPPGGCPTPTPTFCSTGQTPPPGGCPTPTPPPDLRCPVGTTKFTVVGLNDANYTDFTFTVSVEFTNNRSVDFKSNLGVRELLVLGSGGVNRYQFDPPIKLGNRFQATGGHTIQKTVFCYVKPAPTPVRTPTPTPPATPTPPPTPPCSCGNPGTGSILVEDFYGRTTSGTWTNADKGGPYSLAGSSVNFNVNNGSGAMTVPTAGGARGALLNNINASNVDIKFKVNADKVAAGGKYYVYAIARHNGNNEYRPRLIFNTDGSISVHASILVNGVETGLGNPVKVDGLTQCGCKWIWFRAQVFGSNPTTIRVKAWADGSSEPAGWQYTTTNSNSVCQQSGSVGLRTYLSASVTNAPVTFRFDNYTVTSL
jgi:hypothetical protein